jgi:hypothetical protein
LVLAAVAAAVDQVVDGTVVASLTPAGLVELDNHHHKELIKQIPLVLAMVVLVALLVAPLVAVEAVAVDSVLLVVEAAVKAVLLVLVTSTLVLVLVVMLVDVLQELF